MIKFICFLISIILALSFLSCLDNDKSNEQNELQEAKNQYFQEMELNRRSNEFVSLLSIKYDLNVELTHQIIDAFIRETSVQDFSSPFKARTMEEFERLKAEVSRPSVEERVRKISVENNVDESKIAALIIDYKTWFEARHD